ncbi:MAG TPA: hypothetical protein VES19_16920 [Candidatus Limnocylindrales bacterium]|nr:hypothetical protein [Candidatus Limnocylindrales bacterium]
MDISLGEPRIYGLEPRIPFEELKRRAEEKKTAALGAGFGGFIQRPKAEDVVLAVSQRRVEPFWHVACTAHYVYDRTRMYTVPASAGDVRSVSFLGSDFAVVTSGKAPPSFGFEVLEHCTEDIRDELYVDGVTGTAMGNGAAVATGPRTEVADPSLLAADETLVIPPEQRASAIVRQLLAKLLRPLQADTVFEESLAVEALELYYRPIWAFEFHHPAKDKRGVVEVDALTGEAKTASALKVSQFTRLVSKDALFDIGADTVGLLVPGGSIAVKLARVAIDRSY